MIVNQPDNTACGLITQQVQSVYLAVFCLEPPRVGKKNSSSVAAEAISAEPWTAFSVVSES